MLPSLSGVLRLALVVSMGAGAVAWDGHNHAAYADDDGDDGDDSADDGGDDGGGDDGNGGGEDDNPDDKDQPAITAGGLFTMKTYPIRENERPLTMTQQITQARLAVGTDVSNKGAFESAGLNLEALHGYTDNFMLLGGFQSAYNVHQFNIYGGFEGALLYDVIDFRIAARVSRTAIPKLEEVMGMPGVFLPSGKYTSGDTKFGVELGFPFRYVARPEIAIVALQSVMTIDFNATDCADVPNMSGGTDKVCANEVKPDISPSLAIVTNPIAAVSLVVQAQLIVADFDFTKKTRVPATIRIQFSPTRQLDIGGEFTLLNIKPTDPDGDGPLEAPGAFDNRFLSLFMAARFGK
jgi:hypothetical protein